MRYSTTWNIPQWFDQNATRRQTTGES